MAVDPAAAFVRDTRSPLARALGERGVVVKIVDDLGGQLDGIPLALRPLSTETRGGAVAAAIKYLTGPCGLSEAYLYDTSNGAAELDLETKIQLLAVALCEPAPPHAPVVASADELRGLIEANDAGQLFEVYADFLAERSPLSRAKSMAEVEAVVTALGKGMTSVSRLTSFDSTTLRSALYSLAVRHEMLTSSNSSPSSPSTALDATPT